MLRHYENQDHGPHFHLTSSAPALRHFTQFLPRPLHAYCTHGMNPHKALHTYLDAIVAVEGAYRNFTRNGLWTPEATRGLACLAGTVGRLAGSTSVCVAAKNHQDCMGQSEYLTLDVCAWDKNRRWAPPLFVAEHESTSKQADVQYSAWKLLVVEANCRVLVTYYGCDTPFRTKALLRESVQEVCASNRGREIILISAEAVEAESDAHLRSIHGDPDILCG